MSIPFTRDRKLHLRLFPGGDISVITRGRDSVPSETGRYHTSKHPGGVHELGIRGCVPSDEGCALSREMHKWNSIVLRFLPFYHLKSSTT
jgi:hypothetical protein